MITRNRIYNKLSPSRDAHKIFIVCEGSETEPNYFEFFEGLSSNLQLITIPPCEGTDPLKLMELAKKQLIGEGRKYTVDYLQKDKVWFLIDTDSWEKEGKIQPLRDFCAIQNKEIKVQCDEAKEYSAWNVAQSNPCFEIWLYYHFYNTTPNAEYLNMCDTFKAYVNESISGGFNFGVDQIRLKEAIANSKKNYSYTVDDELALYSTEVYELGEEIYKFVKNDLMKLRNKLG